jgi:hypothetical protein
VKETLSSWSFLKTGRAEGNPDIDMSETIRITDLAEPELSDLQKQIRAFGETLQVNLDANEILEEAKAEVSMGDFGPMDFLERLELLCDEWGSDPGLNNLGRMNLRNKLLLFAKSRLLIEDLLQRHPEIHDVQIRAPIIVAGLPRSGTTHLLNLMAADSRLRALPLWESYEPVPMPGEALLGDGTDPRYKRCAEAWEVMQQTVPKLAAMHPMNPDHIHEELELMGPDFASYNFEWLCQCPRWRDHYYNSDQTPHYEYMKGAAHRAAQGLSRCDDRRHPPGPGLGHPVRRHHDCLRATHVTGQHRPAKHHRLLVRPGASPAAGLHPGPGQAAGQSEYRRALP